MKTAVEALLAVADIGGRLGPDGDKLRMLLPANCPPELKDAIRQHKLAVLEVLRFKFWVVRSDTLNAMVFWTPHEAAKESLIAAGADPGSIYTVAELAQLVNRRITAEELRPIHAVRNCFGGRLADQ